MATIILIVAFAIVVRPPVNIYNQQLFIERSDGSRVSFQVEVAKTYKQRAKGLMFRTEMPENSGMLFLFESERVVDMWMKNTLLPLDMIFIGKGGIIKKISKNTTPNSLKIVSSDSRVIAVLEINAIMTEKFFIRENDVVLHSDLRSIK